MSTRILAIDPERQLARVSRACVCDELRTAAERARPHLRPGPGDARPLHARRDARQQLVRRPLVMAGHGRTSDQRRGAGGPDSTTACGLTVGPTSDAELRTASSPRAAARGEIYARLRELRDRYADLIRAPLPEASRAASRATTSTTCCPRTASTSPGRWSAPRGPASRSSRRPAPPGAEPARRGRSWCSATRTSSRPPTHVARS